MLIVGAGCPKFPLIQLLDCNMYLSMNLLVILMIGIIAPVQSTFKAAFFSVATIDEASTEKILLSSFLSPSEIACSQKCLHNKQCNFKKYNPASQKCELLHLVTREDFIENTFLMKREQVPEQMSPGNSLSSRSNEVTVNCVNSSLGNTSLLNCSGHGVFASCDAALKSNNFRTAIYWIMPPALGAAVNTECTRKYGKSFAVLHHSNEKATSVKGYEEAGSYKHNFTYALGMNLVVSIINQANYCQQYTKVRCHYVEFIGKKIAWIRGRDWQKLEFWGGGPSNGTGCECGITNSCANKDYKCNCDANDPVWRTDEGKIVKKEVLPVTAIALGDTGNDIEEIIYTLGPVLCII